MHSEFFFRVQDGEGVPCVASTEALAILAPLYAPFTLTPCPPPEDDSIVPPDWRRR